MRVNRCLRVLQRASVLSASYSNTPFERRTNAVDEDDDEDDCGVTAPQKGQRGAPAHPFSGAARLPQPDWRALGAAHHGASWALSRRRLGAAAAALPPPPPPSPLRPAFIVPTTPTTTFNRNESIKSFRHAVCGATDVSMRPLQLLLSPEEMTAIAAAARPAASAGSPSFGERLRDTLWCRWSAKFYGQVTFGPRNYPYPSSRWLARRFKMKKHRIIKRFRFRRYKLAAVANLPFARMIRVGMLPELKSSKTKKGDAVEAGLSEQLVSAAKSSSGVAKAKGRRSRPRSKYQV